MKTVKDADELNAWFRSANFGQDVCYHEDTRNGYRSLSSVRRETKALNKLAQTVFDLGCKGQLFLYQTRKDGVLFYCARKLRLSPDLTPSKDYGYV